MNREELYEQYLNLQSGTELQQLSSSEISKRLEMLLRSLPNGGKLYKYRSIKGSAFDYAYESLQNGYLWLATANTLNDDLDCSLNFDPMKYIEEAKQSFLSQPWLYLARWIKANPDKKLFSSLVDQYYYSLVKKCINLSNWELDENRAVRLLGEAGLATKDARKFIDDLLNFVDLKVHEHAEIMKSPISHLSKFNETMRKNIYVFSMSETYDGSSMWGRYADSNCGFCIEYDFNKASVLSEELKRVLLCLYRVTYKGEELPEYSFFEIHQLFQEDGIEDQFYKQICRNMLNKLLIKTKDWDDEKEWRIMVCYLLDNKLYADLVSGIIIDKRVLETTNAQKLIALAEERGWSVRVRMLNHIGNKHIYEAYSSRKR